MPRTSSHLLWLVTLLFVPCLSPQCKVSGLPTRPLPQIEIEEVRANNQLPANEINSLCQDHQGFIWIGTKSGLFRYDGYRVKQLRNIPSQPYALASNTVKVVAEDSDGGLWVGTQKGLTHINLHTGRHTHYHFSDFSNCDVVNCILFTRSGDMWVGTEGGLYGRRKNAADSLTFYCDKRHNSKVPHCSVNALLEDADGYVWIGTWDKGLYRFNPRNGQFYEMPKFNDSNSAQALATDQYGHLWVGTWGHGLYCITNPHATYQTLQFRHFSTQSAPDQIPSDVIWHICEDAANRLLWVGTKNGLSLIDLNQDGGTLQPQVPEPSPDFFAHGINAVFADRQGRVWLNAYQSGMVTASIRPQHFNTRQLSPQQRLSDHISCLAFDTEGQLLVGTSHSGIILPNSDNASIPLPSRVNAVLPLAADTLLVGTLRDGLFVLYKGQVVQHYHKGNAPWLHDNCIYALYQDASRRIIIGTWRGVSILHADGSGTHLDGKAIKPLENMQVSAIIQNDPASLWLGTEESGIIHLTGDIGTPSTLRYRQYSTLVGSDFKTLNIYRLLSDRHGRIWACSQEAGLMLFDEQQDGFANVGSQYGIPEDDMFSLEEASDGSLWVSTRHHLVSLTLNADDEVSDLRFFARKDVIDSDHFGIGFSAVSPSGELCFAGRYAFATFQPTDIPRQQRHLKAIITDLKLNGHSIVPLPDRQLTLQPNQRDLTIEFSSLDFHDIDGSRYAYMLDGLDREWHYTDAGVSQVSYSQLPSGTYNFRLRCTADGASWSPDEQVLSIRLLAPVYLRWYAWLAYIVIVLGLMMAVVHYLSERKLHQQELQQAHMERQNALDLLEEYKQRTYEKVREDLFADICGISTMHTDEDFVRRCLICVQRNIADPDFNLAQFADAMCTAPSTLYKKLKAATGLTTSAFIRTVRLKSGKELLSQNPSARVADIAYAVGYSDPKYFSSCFKKEFGLLPSDFVNGQKEGDGAKASS